MEDRAALARRSRTWGYTHRYREAREALEDDTFFDAAQGHITMSSDPNKKSARNFQCRDVLWETFEQMARELECSVDYLINEAMKQYARQRSYGSRTPYPAGPGAARTAEGTGHSGQNLPSQSPSTAAPPMNARGGGTGVGSLPLPPPPARGLGPPPNARSGSGGPPGLPPPGRQQGMGGAGPTPPPPRGGNTASGHGGLAMPPPRSAPPPLAPPPRTVPPPLPRGMSAPPPPMSANAGANGGFVSSAPQAAILNVIYQGEKMAVNKDRFVIGRGKQSSDLTLKDPNVSRQHAMVEFQNGVYFMVDMGSTNGVEYNGQRIARKQIAEGDVFRICDHDLFFTYR